MYAYVAFHYHLDPTKIEEEDVIRLWSYLAYNKQRPLQIKSYTVLVEDK